MKIPISKPNLTLAHFNAAIAQYNIDRTKYPIMLVGKRNHYDAMVGGAQNDRNFYDDALMVSVIDSNGKETFQTFNFNTDPSIKRNGVASLVAGLYYSYKFDWHARKYLAVCQRAAVVKVKRDGGAVDIGYLGINIHSGGLNGTHSLGCQTSPPTQFSDFMQLLLTSLGFDYHSLFVDDLKPTKIERDNAAKILNNPKIRNLVIPYLLIE